jgi:hypothetical protein
MSEYKTIVTERNVTETQYEVVCKFCQRTFVLNHLPRELPYECPDCKKGKLEREFQEKHKYLINGRITAIVSDGDEYSGRDIRAMIILDEEGDYWRIEGGQDTDYGYILNVEENEEEPKQ